MLRATTACNFSSLVWPAGSAPTALASLLFDPPEPPIIGKHSVSRLSYLFAHLHLLSSDSFSSTLLSSNLSLLSASSLLCFSSVHIVGSLTSPTFPGSRSCRTSLTDAILLFFSSPSLYMRTKNHQITCDGTCYGSCPLMKHVVSSCSRPTSRLFTTKDASAKKWLVSLARYMW